MIVFGYKLVKDGRIETKTLLLCLIFLIVIIIVPFLKKKSLKKKRNKATDCFIKEKLKEVLEEKQRDGFHWWNVVRLYERLLITGVVISI